MKLKIAFSRSIQNFVQISFFYFNKYFYLYMGQSEFKFLINFKGNWKSGHTCWYIVVGFKIVKWWNSNKFRRGLHLQTQPLMRQKKINQLRWRTIYCYFCSRPSWISILFSHVTKGTDRTPPLLETTLSVLSHMGVSLWALPSHVWNPAHISRQESSKTWPSGYVHGLPVWCTLLSISYKTYLSQIEIAFNV